MANLCVGIIFGGESTEHEVSLQSAKNIINAIDRNRFKIILLGIDKQGQWHLSNTDNDLFINSNLFDIKFNSSNTNLVGVPNFKKRQLIDIKNIQILTQIDIIFPVTHGAFGENGSLQGMLKMINLPFVGSDVLGSAICMDKDITKRLLRDNKLKVVPFVTITKTNYKKYSFANLRKRFGLPLFIKPSNQGSSIGISKVNDEVQFNNAIQLAFKFNHKVLVEKNIKGREIECAVLGNNPPQASTCGEILFNSNFYSYDDKYINDSTKLTIPAVLDQKTNDRIRNIAIKAYQITECRDMARVDVFLTAGNEIIINEINTIPGFTNISMYPKLWQASGLTCSALISKLIDSALERYIV